MLIGSNCWGCCSGGSGVAVVDAAVSNVLVVTALTDVLLFWLL